MREIIARFVSLLTVVVIVTLSLWFANEHNPARKISASQVIRPAQSDSDKRPVQSAGKENPTNIAAINRGRTVYGQQGCAACHAIAGDGNPQHPLDGIGAGLPAAEIQRRITATSQSLPRLAAATERRKRRYLEMSPEDLEALATYVASIPTAK